MLIKQNDTYGENRFSSLPFTKCVGKKSSRLSCGRGIGMELSTLSYRRNVRECCVQQCKVSTSQDVSLCPNMSVRIINGFTTVAVVKAYHHFPLEIVLCLGRRANQNAHINVKYIWICVQSKGVEAHTTRNEMELHGSHPAKTKTNDHFNSYSLQCCYFRHFLPPVLALTDGHNYYCYCFILRCEIWWCWFYKRLWLFSLCSCASGGLITRRNGVHKSWKCPKQTKENHNY